MPPLTIHSLSIVVLAVALLIFLHIMYHGRSKPLLAALVFLSVVSLWIYTDFFRLHSLVPKTPEYTQLYGKKHRKSLVHWHETLHYYMGGKYFRELGYDGLYETIVLADVESVAPAVTRSAIKNLRDNPNLINKRDAIKRARAEFRPRFSDERWAEFKRDLEHMKSIAYLPDWLDKALFDAGYNPPPTWALIGGTVANLVPISQNWFDWGPTFDQVGILPWFDFTLIFIAFFFVGRCFGLESALAMCIAFGTSFIINYAYNIGSLFRFTWFFGLVMSLGMLKRGRYRWAGAFMALATVDRLFPGFFAIGAALALLHRWWRDRRNGWMPLRDFCGSGLLTGGVMVALSLILYDPHLWVDFLHKIARHSTIRFTNHLGYFGVATFADWVPNQNFWGEEGARRFLAWSNRLNESWEQIKWMHLPFMIAAVFCAAWIAGFIPAWESALLMGTLLLHLFTFTVIYYYSYLAVIPAVLFARNPGWGSAAIFSGFFAIFIAMRAIPWVTPDDLVQNYYISYMLYIFLVFWMAVRFIENSQWKKPA